MRGKLAAQHGHLPVGIYLEALHERLRSLSTGTPATYIGPLADADPAWFGIAIATVDGHCYEAGDARRRFTIQSLSKPFAYGMALQDRGVDEVLRRVGVEPTGNPFNSISVDERTRRAFNPMVNAGAIVTTNLISGNSRGERLDRLRAGFARLAGRELEIDDAVFSSERATGDRNRAIAYFMRTFDIIPDDVEAALDMYFAQCSLLIDCRDLALMGATLANHGVHPITGDRAVPASVVPRVLSVMTTCGMYDFSGEWVYRVGLPAKSGVAGGILAVLPGQLGIAVFSPPLDECGNSVRGIAVCEDVASTFHLHTFSSHTSVQSVVRRNYTGAAKRSKRVRPTDHVEVLQKDGASVVVFELQGQLYFGSTEHLTRSVVSVAGEGVLVVLDFSRVASVDAAAMTLLTGLGSLLAERGTELLLAAIPDDLSVQPELVEALAHGSLPPPAPSTDRALERCEDELLRRRGLLTGLPVVSLEDFELLVGLGQAELDALTDVATVELFGAGEVVFRAGDPGDRMYFIRSGVVSVVLDVAGKTRRLATMGPGATFGEMAIIDGERRSATIAVDEDATCLVVPTKDLDALNDKFPKLGATLYRNLTRSLSRRLREAHEEIRALAR